MQQSPPGLSWMGTSYLCPEDAARELAALRARPMLRKDACKLMTTTTRGRRADGRRGSTSPARHWSGSPFPATRPTSSPTHSNFNGYPSALRSKLTTDQAIVELQEEKEALRTALFPGSGSKSSDYRRAQGSMGRLDNLEIALWEAHRREASAWTLGQTRKMQEANQAERVALEADLQRRRDHLEQSCRGQVRALQHVYEARLADLGRVAPAIIDRASGEYLPGSGDTQAIEFSPSTPTGTTTVAVVELASRASGTTVAKTPHPVFPEKGTTAAAISAAERCTEGEGMSVVENKGQASSGVVAQAVSAAAPVAVVVGSSRASKALVELRSELGKHLAAVAHVLDGGRHLQEATRVMGEIEKLEALDRLEAETKAGGELVMSLARTKVQQKQAQVEKIQRDKHERLRRSLETSGTEELRLLSVRQNGALGRLAVRCRAANHEREIELRGKLTRVKGGVARLWREHNKSCCGHGPRSYGAGACTFGKVTFGKLSGAERGGRPSSPGQQGGGTVYASKHHENTAAENSGEEGNGGLVGEEEEAGRDREKARRNEPEIADENFAHSGRRRSEDDRMNPDGIARAASTTAHGQNTELGTAVASTVVVSEGDQTEHEEARPASLLGPAATSGRKSSTKRAGAPRRRKKHITSAVATDAALTTVTDTLGDGSFGVLNEGEAQALAALGRGAPEDPRVLLSTFPLSPPRRRRQRPESSSRVRPLDEEIEESAFESTSRDNGLGTVANVDGLGCDGRERVGDGLGAAFEGGTRGDTDYELLDSAMEKLARKIQAEEDLSRRQLGMVPLPVWS